MTYNGTHFNDTEVLTHTRKQWLIVGSRGNGFTEAQLDEVYSLIKNSQPKTTGNANNSKLSKSSTEDRY